MNCHHTQPFIYSHELVGYNNLKAIIYSTSRRVMNQQKDISACASDTDPVANVQAKLTEAARKNSLRPE